MRIRSHFYKRFACLLFVFYGTAAHAQDSLVSFRDLTFRSEAEEKLFAGLLNGKADPAELFAAPYTTDAPCEYPGIRGQLDACIALLKPALEGKSNAKKIRIIYEHIHKEYLKAYRLENSFCDIFSRGQYNCVSASAFFAIVFEASGIPYKVKESPQHVYLEAFPDNERILVETTSPEKGYMVYNDEFAKEFIRAQVKRKVISQEELFKSSTKDLFDKYYFSSENIRLLQLAGLQHYNFALYDMESEHYKSALDHIKRAYFLYPSDRVRFVLRQALLLETGRNEYRTVDEVKNLAMLCRYNNMDDEIVTGEVIRSEFERLTDLQLVNNSNVALFDSSFQLIYNSVNDTSVKSWVSLLYHYHVARIGILRGGKPEQIMSHLTSAYAENGSNSNLQSLILASLGQEIEVNSDPQHVLNLLDRYGSAFPFLSENDMFNSVKAECLLEMSYRNFTFNNSLSGEQYLKQFEEFYTSKKNISIDNLKIERAYLSGAGMYFKKGNQVKSRQLLKAGLIHYPGSYRMKQSLSQQ